MRRDTMTFYYDLYVDDELFSPNREVEIDDRFDMQENRRAAWPEAMKQVALTFPDLCEGGTPRDNVRVEIKDGPD